MSEPKNKKKKPDLLVTILSIALIAFVIVFFIMAVQYYKLTNSLMEVRQIQQTEQVGMETGESETSTEDVVSGVDTEENTKKETKEETIRTTENGTEKQTVTETVAESGSETESETAEPEISTPETESETEQPVVIQTETSQPETQSVPVVHQASELTIQDIPNSLYARLQNPEELRTTLFQWLQSQGSDALDCVCDYDYTEDEGNLYFILHFDGFSVEVIYSVAGNTYSYGVA